MSKRNYYDVLGVSKNATEKEIKMAYRKLAMKYHPDRLKDGSSDEKMQELNEAYDVLKDKEKRENYDRFGTENGPQGFSGYSSAGMGDFGNFAENIFNNIFTNFAQGGPRSRSSRTQKIKGDDILTEIVVSFTEAIKGKEFTEQLTKYDLCTKCKGTGANSNADIKTCSTCRGAGQIKITQKTPFGIIENVQTCSTCHGTGKVIVNKCRTCNGNLYVKKLKKVTFKIPQGSDNGDKIKLIGYGEKGENGGESGDLYVIIRVRPHKYWTRKGLDLYLDLPISFLSVVKEDSIKIPTPYGTERIKIKSNYQSGKVLNVTGKGIRNKKSVGNLKIKLQVVMPPFTSDEYSQMAKILENYDDNVNDDFLNAFNKAK